MKNVLLEWMSKLLVGTVLTVGLAYAQPVDFVLYDSRDAALQRLDDMMTAVESLRDEIDRAVFDVDALAFDLAFEAPEAIVAWVRDEIAYEPYAGLLRGPSGTLQARAGNALDQATLLAHLLNGAGYEARIAIGQLTDADATALLEAVSRPRPAAPPIGDLEAMRDILRDLARIADDDESRLQSALDETVTADPVRDPALLAELEDKSEGLESALAAAGVDLGSDAQGALLAEAREYAWVEFRMSPSDPWTAAHPTGLEPTQELAADRILEGSIPPELMHRVRIQAWIESKQGSELHHNPVMQAWERPVANAANLVLGYANFPNSGSVSSIDGFDVEAVVTGTEVFAPYFMGELAPGAQIFDLDGRTVAPDVANNVAAGVFRTVAGAAEEAVGALGSLGASDGDGVGGPLELSGHGIDITWISPTGEEILDRRWILDRIGPENRRLGVAQLDPSAPDPARAILGRHRIMISTGPLPAGYVLDRALARILEARPFYEFMVERMFDPESATNLPPDALGGDPPMDLLVAFDSFERIIGSVDAGPGFRPEPAAIVISERLAPDADADFTQSVDIVRNPRRVLAMGEGDASPVGMNARAALRRGIWETLVERELVAGIREGAVLVAAANVAPPYTVLVPGRSVDVGSLGLSAEAAANVARDLAQGWLVVLGTASDEGVAWWRVDPLSGTTLGITADGRGQAALEYEIQLYDNALNLVNGVKSLKECQGKGGLEEACCLVQAHINNVAGLGFGSAIGAAFGSGVGLAVGIITSTKYTSINFAGGMGFQCPAGSGDGG